jgi:hypothetical protein
MDDIWVGAILLGGGGGMCAIGRRIIVPVPDIFLEGEASSKRTEKMDRNDAEVD